MFSLNSPVKELRGRPLENISKTITIFEHM